MTFWSTLGIIALIILIVVAILIAVTVICVIRSAGIASQNEDTDYYAEQAKALEEYNKKKNNK